MNLSDLYDKKTEEILNKYSDIGGSPGTDIREALNNSDNAEIIIPVLGMQGMGKSTLINALLKENILPNDADETTCVPVEVKYGDDECAIVHFYDDSKKVKVHTREELNEYVDNNSNPANEKQVSAIELFRRNDMLRSGLIIVDLPGVGSLTKENEITTNRYVENLCSAIFVIPTVPTIRNKEALFIKSLWSQFGKAIFVQNDFGESKEEMEESVSFNKLILKKIANELHNPYNDEIIVVNAYEGIKGAVSGDDALVDKSNIKALKSEIDTLAQNWDFSRESILRQRIILTIQYALSVIVNRISDSSKSVEELRKENEVRLKQFKEDTIKISDKVEEIKRFLRDKEDEVCSKSREKAHEAASQIRSQIYKVIEGGVFDGEFLSTAFKDIQDDVTKDVFDSLLNLLQDIKMEVEDKFAELNEIQLEAVANLASHGFEKDESFKWEKGFEKLVVIGGGIGSVLGASALAGLLFTNPAGWIVAGVGFAIAGICSLFGFSVKKMVQKKRANETKREIAPHIDEIEKSLRKAIPAKYEEYENECFKALDSVIEKRRSEEKEFAATLAKDLAEDIDITEFDADRTFLIEKQKQFDNV